MTPNDKGYTVSVTYTYKATEKNESGEDVQVNKTLENQPIQVIKENDIWKVVPISM
jgi:ATP sulfurylase